VKAFNYFCGETKYNMPHRILLILSILFLFACNQDKINTLKVNKNSVQFGKDLSNTNNTEDFKDRDIWQHPDYVIGLLGDLTNKSVADLGAGSGYFSFKILKTAKKVIAIDIDQRFIKYMNHRISDYPKNLSSKFEARLASIDDPKLTDDEVQIVLVVNTYIYIQNRPKYFADLRKAISSNGKLLIVDFKNIKLPVGPPESIKLSGSQVVRELEQAGYKNVKLDNNTLEYQYIIQAENQK
jgi:ubiquinone/menaquinone biosynthesis C-methylase UbiE